MNHSAPVAQSCAATGCRTQAHAYCAECTHWYCREHAPHDVHNEHVLTVAMILQEPNTPA